MSEAQIQHEHAYAVSQYITMPIRQFDGAQLHAFLEPLRGKNLACFCKLNLPCHVDPIMELLYGHKTTVEMVRDLGL